MNKVLSKRIPREFRSNLPKYIALLLLIVLCMYLVTAMVASSETIIIRTDEHNTANHVEDGQFTTFLPLTDEQEKDITDKGVTLERMYSLDIKAEDGSTLRVMKNRRNIDLVELISGEYPSKDNEAAVERRYAEEHSLDGGSKLTVGGTEYTVCGIGASPDYDAPYQNMSDMAVSSKNFGIIFVTDSEYERVSDSSKSAQTFTYGYLLGNDMTDDKLKELIEDFDFDYSVTTKSDIERSSKVFTELMSGMVITLVGTSAVIFVVVMYLMMGVMIDRSSFGISLLKTFGYSKKDVKKLYLDGNAITIAISAIICLPLSKFVMDRIYPSFIPNVACGINLNFAWYLYPALFIAVMLIYLLTSTLLVRKLNKITPAEVLKNRE